MRFVVGLSSTRNCPKELDGTQRIVRPNRQRHKPAPAPGHGLCLDGFRGPWKDEGATDEIFRFQWYLWSAKCFYHYPVRRSGRRNDWINKSSEFIDWKSRYYLGRKRRWFDLRWLWHVIWRGDSMALCRRLLDWSASSCSSKVSFEMSLGVRFHFKVRLHCISGILDFLNDWKWVWHSGLYLALQHPS